MTTLWISTSIITSEEFIASVLAEKLVESQVYKNISRLKGSISAEHGIGLIKKEYLGFSRSKEEIALMKSIKNLFDPNNILNPGKIFD